MTSGLDWKVITTVVVAIIAWLVSFSISVKTFKKNDISRQKDKIITLVEKFIDDLIKEFEKNSNTSDDIDNFISYRVSLIEIQINSIEKRTKKEILGSGLLTKLRSNPIDIFEASRVDASDKKLSHQVCGDLYDLSTLIITEIENNYNEWFFYDYFRAIKTRLLFRLWHLLSTKYDILFKWTLISTTFYFFGWISSEFVHSGNINPILTSVKYRYSIHNLDAPQTEDVDNVRFSEGFITMHQNVLEVYGNFNNSCMVYLYSKRISRKQYFLENKSKAHLIGFGNNGVITTHITLKDNDSIIIYCDGILKRISSS